MKNCRKASEDSVMNKMGLNRFTQVLMSLNSLIGVSKLPDLWYWSSLNRCNPMIRLQNSFGKNMTHKTSLPPADSPETLSPGRFWRAEVEFEVEHFHILHPDVEMKGNHPRQTKQNHRVTFRDVLFCSCNLKLLWAISGTPSPAPQCYGIPVQPY